MPLIVRVDSLWVKYPRAARPALECVSFDLVPGVTSLLGKNGSGKSTLIRVIATVQVPTAGSVQVNGMSASVPEDRQSIRERLGYLPQDFRFTPRFTVEEFVDYAAWLRKVPANERARRVTRAIEEVGLEASRRKRLGSLSGGTLRRAGIAQAIVNEPDVLLLDEPSSGLDPEQRIRLRELLSELGRRKCVLVSTHLLGEVAAGGHKVLVLVDGALRFSGPVGAFMALDDHTSLGDTPLERAYTRIHHDSTVQAIGG